MVAPLLRRLPSSRHNGSGALREPCRGWLRQLSILGLMLAPVSAAQDLPALERPDGKPADMGQPVQVYVLLGQSNMLGFGKVSGLEAACRSKGLYPYMVEDDGSWSVRRDVRYVRVMCSGSGPSTTYNNDWLTVSGDFGPELGIGHHLGQVTEAPVLLLKSCIGNRSLGYDLLPPNAKGYEGPRDPSKRPRSGPWYAGVQYDGDVAAAKAVLKDLSTHYPGARSYEVAGFFWWQGDKDFRNAEHAAAYEANLLLLIESLRKDFDAPEARFVCATLGQTRKGATGPLGQILEAQLAIDGEFGKYPTHRGLVASVYTNPLIKGGSSSGHYGGNAETYMNVGLGMGEAMARLIVAAREAPVRIPGVEPEHLQGTLRRVYTALSEGRMAEAHRLLSGLRGEGTETDRAQDEVALALQEYLQRRVARTLEDLQALQDAEDYCALREALNGARDTLQGVPAFDAPAEFWTTLLASDSVAAELAAGDALQAILERSERLDPASLHGRLAGFVEQNPGTLAARRAQDELEEIEAAAQAFVEEIAELGVLGDHYTRYERIHEQRRAFAGISLFDTAYGLWMDQESHPAVRDSIADGKAYAEVFEEVAEAEEQLEKDLERSARSKSASKRQKAEEKARASHHRKLAALEARLERISDRSPGTYYGEAALRSRQAYAQSGGKTLVDKR